MTDDVDVPERDSEESRLVGTKRRADEPEPSEAVGGAPGLPSSKRAKAPFKPLTGALGNAPPSPRPNPSPLRYRSSRVSTPAAKLSRPFKSPVLKQGARRGDKDKESELVERIRDLEKRVDRARLAVKYKRDGQSKTLPVLTGKWRSAGRAAAEYLWKVTGGAHENESAFARPVGGKAWGWDDTNGTAGNWGWDVEPDTDRRRSLEALLADEQPDSPPTNEEMQAELSDAMTPRRLQGRASDHDKAWEAATPDEEWDVGKMMRMCGVDASLLGWSATEGGFVD